MPNELLLSRKIYEFRFAYIQYKTHIHLLEVDSYKYISLYDYLQYRRLRLYMGCFYIKVDTLFVKMRVLGNHTFHLLNIQN